ncbi:MAG: methyltransferase domain-containing protein, partial [Cyanobacteria bacterium REEB65]|nr:methyltransferase domain-containing protein [Cyanobacteria bacterium REEB65]
WGGTLPESVIDVACGTGAAAVAMALRGVRVAGLDRSPQMLGIARQRASRWGAAVDWILQDFRDLEGPCRFAAATCFYDAVNYCQSLKELEALLAGVARCVESGGTLLFDAITQYGIRVVWGDRQESRVEDDLVRVWQPQFDRRTSLGTLDVTYLERAADGTWQRFDERHVHRGFDPVEVLAALHATGWGLEGMYRCFTLEPPDAATYRVAYLAQRR